jgi:hypothetical protein
MRHGDKTGVVASRGFPENHIAEIGNFRSYGANGPTNFMFALFVSRASRGPAAADGIWIEFPPKGRGPEYAPWRLKGYI